MERRYKITGKFRLLNGKGKIVKEEIYINKITTATNTRSAMDYVLVEMKKKFVKKYQDNIELKQISNVVVKIV